MRLAVCLLALLTLASTAAAQATAPVSSQPHRTAFSIQPLPDLGNDDDHRGPRLELERAVSRRFTAVLGTQLTLHNSAYLLREPVFRRLDLGVRYYARGRALDGPFLGLYGGYDRVTKGYTVDTHYRIPAGIVGATAGWSFRPLSRLLITPAFGLEYGRPNDVTFGAGHRYLTAAPRIGFGISF